MTPEQRAALESLRGDLRSLYWTTRYFGYAVEQATVERKQVDRWLAALQAMLNEKGGDSPDPRDGMHLSEVSRHGLPVAGADTAPPDTPARIAAPPDKPSLAERIEEIAGELWRNHGGDDRGLTAIASELREIAEEIRIGDDDVQTGNPVGWADRLAPREK